MAQNILESSQSNGGIVEIEKLLRVRSKLGLGHLKVDLEEDKTRFGIGSMRGMFPESLKFDNGG
ncbi:hypothetical protein COLO4_07279 [Corchorus olitorius]|uniref:Uncharacterized protein n=1 Tax=Corchorus olitorius TaxID=93759 RepID=A0A1R3KK88_9ROSI|nr:hypothetical protein COLO4_07279 [Corchorus olitorius]